jgi:RNA polymerase sigma-70 factor, ECF subfamily
VTTSRAVSPAATSPEISSPPTDARALYDSVIAAFGPALVRLARAYEHDPDRRQDLLQDIHFALFRSFASFDHRCALRTWTYRVAHNVGASHVLRDRRRRARPLVGLEVLEQSPQHAEAPHDSLVDRLDAERRREQLVALLERLAPLDRQLMVLYLEGLDAAAISEIMGISSVNVATKIHRIKRILAAHVRGANAPSPSTGETDEHR